MSRYLVDTNVVSELSKETPNSSVTRFMAAQDDLWLSVIVIGEMELGVQSLPEGRRRDGLRDWLSRMVADFDERILPVERAEAEWAATFRARVVRDGGALPLADALIAATAKVRGLIVATRNVSDFDGLDVELVNPWESP